MRPQLSPRDRRALGIGALLLVPGLMWSLALAPYLRALDDTRSRLEVERSLLQRELAMLDQIDRYPVVFAEGIERLSEALPRFVSGEGPGAMSAALTSYVQARGQQSGILITRVEPVEAPPVRDMERVALKVSGEGDLQGILTLLRSIEGGPTLVHVRGLQIRSVARHAAPGAAPAAGAMEVLSFEFVASGYALPPLQSTDSARQPSSERLPDAH